MVYSVSLIRPFFFSPQCILTRSDYDVFFFGESVALDLPQAFTCPLCGSHGFTEATLQEHVAAEHSGKLSPTGADDKANRLAQSHCIHKIMHIRVMSLPLSVSKMI